MSHQVTALRRAWPKEEFAFFHEMGTGKTFTTINLAAARFLAGQIDACVIFCPTPIKNVWYTGLGTWIDEDGVLQGSEIEKWCPVDYSVWVWESGDQPSVWFKEKRENELKFLVVGIEAMSIKEGQAHSIIRYFSKRHRLMTAVDESSGIKNYKANRTKNIIDCGGLSNYRNILTGTPVTQGLQDLYGQFSFLNQNILGCRNYTVFRNRYCVMGGFRAKQILGYQFEDDLYGKIRPYADYVTKEECMDLPDKLKPPPIAVQPTDNQRRVMKELAKTFRAQDGDHEIEISTILERMTRYQQVIGGTFPYEEEDQYKTKPIPGGNPKLEAMLNLISVLSNDTKVIIWARFVPEIEYIVEALQSVYEANSVVSFYGRTTGEERAANSAKFQSRGSGVRFMVSNQAVGGYGQTWTAASYVIYYSNTFSYQDRYQSEDRAHRKGLKHNVTYQDIEMQVHEDKMILNAIYRKRDLAQEVQEALTHQHVGGPRPETVENNK